MAYYETNKDKLAKEVLDLLLKVTTSNGYSYNDAVLATKIRITLANHININVVDNTTR